MASSFTSKIKKQCDEEEEEEDEDDDDDDDDCQGFIGPLHRPINERVESISEHMIYRNRIELGEILELPKFKNYKAGTPSKVSIILKNKKNQEIKESEWFFVKGDWDLVWGHRQV